MIVLKAEGATKWMYDMGKDILELLGVVYPGYNWAVKVYGDNTGGGFFIELNDFPTHWGYNQPRAHLFGSSSALRADVIKGAGEVLERCYMRRGKSTGEDIKKMDGVPLKDQPLEFKREVAQKEEQQHGEENRLLKAQ